MTTHTNEKQNPLRIAYYFIKYPCRVILTVLLVLILTCIIDSFGFAFNSTSGHSYLVMDNPNVNRKDAIELSMELLAQQSSSIEPKTTDWSSYTLLMMYKTRDSTNILQPSNISDYIQHINNTNNRIPYTDYDQYYSLCLADTTDPYSTYPDCSSSAIYDPIISYFSNMETITQTDINSFIDTNLNNPYTKAAFLSCFEEGFESRRESQYYRSFYRFGLPYPNIDPITSSFKDANDNTYLQDQYYINYIFPMYQDIQIHENYHKNIEAVIMGRQCRTIQYQKLIVSGVLFAAGSILTVFLIMCWHLNSLFLACGAMMQIMLGFPFAYFFYRYLFMITYFDTMSTLVIFLILGVGADDVFVLVDAWVQSPTFVQNPEDLIERMSFAFRRAAKAMIVTTATTFFAFIATSFSPIMPISAFGTWAGCVVAVNYLMVITLYPALLSFWYQKIRKYEKWPAVCTKLKHFICFCSKKKAQNIEQHTSNHLSINGKNESEPQPSFHAESMKVRCLERFLGGIFAETVIKLRWFILIFVLIIVSLSTWKAAGISPLTKQEQWFSDDHYMEKMYSWQQYFNGGSITTLIKIKMVWGIEEKVNRNDVTFWDTINYGKPVFDKDFNPSTADAQDYLIYVCDNLLSNYSMLLYDTNDYFDCWIYEFMNYGERLGLNYPFIFDKNNENNQKEIYFELIKNWTSETKAGAKYLSKGHIGYMDNELKYVFIQFTIPNSAYVPMNEKEELFEEWEDIMIEFNNMAPSGVNKAYQIDSHAWAWMASEKGFVKSALQGIAIAMPLALICLILSTENWIVSIFATSAIIGIICCEVALMVLQGWELGISESIAVVMMIGFSVDYVVHLGNAYVECEESEKRNDKIKFALFTMGISVVSGALTTFGSGFWLIFPEMLFFGKFGVLVMTVVCFSLFFSMIYFIALLAAFGPQGNVGYIPIYKWIGMLFKPLKKCHCQLCKYICCFIGTIDNYYLNENENENENNNDKQSGSNESNKSDEISGQKQSNCTVNSIKTAQLTTMKTKDVVLSE